jgi:hypothetical protein
MTDRVKVPPGRDFGSYADLMDEQAAHFTALDNWAKAHCHDANDLNGALVLPVQKLAPTIADAFSGKLAQCASGMTGIAGRARDTSGDYAATASTRSPAPCGRARCAWAASGRGTPPSRSTR